MLFKTCYKILFTKDLGPTEVSGKMSFDFNLMWLNH